MSFFRICQDPVVAALQQTFNATPVRVPESGIQPLQVVARKGKSTSNWGALRHLFEGENDFTVPFQESDLSEVRVSKTRTVDLDFGLKILEGFLQGFGIPNLPIEAGLKGAKTLSFSFKNSKRKYIEPSLLGRQLKEKKLDIGNSALNIFTKKGYDMLLITSVLTSNSFSIHVESSIDNHLEASVPALQNYLGKSHAGVKLHSDLASDITFESDKWLTFAFSCISVDINELDKTLAIGEFSNYRGEGQGFEPQFYANDEVLVEEDGLGDLLIWDNIE